MSTPNNLLLDAKLACGDNITQLAANCGVSVATIYNWIKKQDDGALPLTVQHILENVINRKLQ